MTRERKPDAIGDILPLVLERLGLEGRMQEAGLGKEWKRIVGESVAQRSSPGRVRDGVLTVKVSNNVWMQEIRFLRESIVEKINGMFPGLKVGDIRLVIERDRDSE